MPKKFHTKYSIINVFIYDVNNLVNVSWESVKRVHCLLLSLSSTASNSNRSSPACSPVLRKRCRSPTLQNVETDNMVEKGSEQSDTSKSPSTPEQLVTRTFSGQSTRSGGKNSKVCPPHSAPPVGLLFGSPPTPHSTTSPPLAKTCCVVDTMHF